MSRIYMIGFIAVALVSFCAAPRVCAEIVYVEPLRLAPDLVTGEESQEPLCDVRGLISQGLIDVGCTLLLELDTQVPEVVVTMRYEQIGAGGWLTVSSSDVVVGRQFAERRYYLLPEDDSCLLETTQMVRQVAFPPFYENKMRLQDNISGTEFIHVPGGTLIVDGIKRAVAGFFLARFETTQAQWEKVMGYNPSVFKGDPSQPVENVSWFEVQQYLEKLQRLGGIEYRLPTELEWEYAARTRGRNIGFAGTTNTDELGDFAWIRGNASNTTHPVGGKAANGLGLYDMSGNVSEWCSDTYFEADDNRRMSIGDAHEKVIRGGSWMLGADYALVRKRDAAAPGSRSSDNGFRIVMPIKED